MQPASTLTNTEALPARLPKGTELEGYVVDGWLRDGGMAAIYRAHHATDGARVALKLQLSSTAQVPEICVRFDREAEAMRRVAHEPYVVELHRAGVLDDGRRYFVMEWVDGDNLEEVLDSLRNQDQRLAVQDVCEIGLDIAKGLAAMHEHGLVHRDLKPANVMVRRDEHDELHVKLVDFGIVAEHGPAHGKAVGGHADEAVMGTSAYMPPEQVAGAPAAPSMDVFALGVVLYEALTGNCVPPDGWSPETLPTIDSVRRKVPPELSALVQVCMSSHAAQRPSSGNEVAPRLAEILLRLQSAGAQRTSADEIPIRTGSTRITPRSELVAGEESVVRTGATEVVLTHEQVVTMSGVVAALAQPELRSDARSDTRSSNSSVASMAAVAAELDASPTGERPARRWWLMVLVLVPLVAGGLWALGRGGGDDDGGDASSTVAASGSMASPSSAAGKDAGLEGAKATPPSIPAPAAAIDPEPTPTELVVAPGVPPSAAAGGGEPDDDVDAIDGAEPDEPSQPVGSKIASSRPKGPDKAACEKMRAEATAAKARRHWSGVLEATTQTACWTGAVFKLDRRRLRVEAYAEMANYARCVKEGGGSTDGRIVARVKWCSKKLAPGVGG